MNWSSVLTKILRGGLGSTLLLYTAVLSVFFYGVFIPGQTLFSNDGPLGELMAQCHQLPARYFGCWADLNSVGFNSSSASAGISFDLQWLLGPVLFSKFFALISLLILGIGAWCLFRELRLSPLACVLGGLAAMLNSSCFSVACWGVGGHDLTIGMSFLAMAAVADPSARLYWLRLILAGMAVGMGVIEGADVGAIFSLFVSAFIVYHAWIAEGSRIKNLALGIGRLAIVAVCAVFLAAQSVNGLVSTSIEGVTGTEQDVQTKAQRWDWATQWSLPKRELLTLVVPGLFGYRLDTPHGGNYWGMMGRSPSWNKYFADGSQGPTPTTGFLRYTGGGNYAGILIVLLALWAASEALRRKASVFPIGQRKWVWYWSVVVLVALMLALGRYAPFYHFFYALPYASTIRNPTKFLYLFSFGVTALFAFAIDGLDRKYLLPAGMPGAGRSTASSGWWRKASRFEKNWLYGCGAVVLIALVGWLMYSQHRDDLVEYLGTVRITTIAESVADFSIQQVGWFIAFFCLAAGLLLLIFSGVFAGKRAIWGGTFLAVLLLTDMGLANRPWVIFWDYQDKYATNPVIDLLRDKPYEHRVALAPVNLQSNLAVLRQLYRIQWLQHQFPYYNIQSFDVVEMPRMPEDFSAFLKMFSQSSQTNALPGTTMFRQIRAWQLTNTRYILAPGDFDVLWNDQSYLSQSPLQTVDRFEIVHKPGVMVATSPEQLTAYLNPSGHFGLFDFTNTLPRAKLYSNWQVNADGPSTLKEIFSPDFDPQSSVVVTGGVPTNAPAGPGSNPKDTSSATVDFVSYAPKDIVLKAAPAVASVLLLNDHFDPNWKVFVDGSPEKLLHCNFLMQGVYLLPGTHTIEFKFLPAVGLLYVTASALTLALIGLATLLVYTYKNRPATAPVAAVPPPAPVEARPRKSEPKKESKKTTNPPQERKNKTK